MLEMTLAIKTPADHVHRTSFVSTNFVKVLKEKMKFALILFATLAVVLVSSDGVIITRPDQVLSQLDTIKVQILDYQDSVLSDISFNRYLTETQYTYYFEKTLSMTKKNIEKISISDTTIRATLAAEPQTACLLNLVNFIDQVIEMSGFAISNCVEDKNVDSFKPSFDFSDLLEMLENETNQLTETIVNALIGRNIYTDGEAIIARVRDQLVDKQAEIDNALADISSKSVGYFFERDAVFANFNVCFDDIGTSIKSSIAVAQAQISMCSQFGSRGARSAQLNAKSFFPQLR